MIRLQRATRTCVAALLLLVTQLTARADIPPVEFEKETLENGLTVIYAPLRQAPVVHVRVLYHVGSRDEHPMRRGFAHMFEHMMFRGSEHVDAQEHMKLILQVGGISNAFTSFDQTTYFQTLPSTNLELALYLEADRMASFKVSDEVFKTERNVVAEEWRMRYANQPYGPMFQDFLKMAFTTHSYRWTPIGDMDQLAAAEFSELQAFFDRYYVPNNACLVIVGDIDIPRTKSLVRKYFGWIPKGPDVQRDIPAEPEQTEARRQVVHRESVPLASIVVGYKVPERKSDDHYALSLIGSIMTDGRTSRLDALLVNSDDPLCRSVGGGDYALEDPSVFVINAVALPEKDPDLIEKKIIDAMNELVENGVTAEELDRARAQARIAIIRSRETADSLAGQLGEEEVFGGDANRVNEEWQRLSRLTPADLQAVARKYFQPQGVTTLQYLPAAGDSAATTAPATRQSAEVPYAPQPQAPRQVQFPPGYPTEPPIAPVQTSRPFEKGVEMDVNGVKVIVMSDHRLPLVNWTLVMRAGGDAAVKGKEGLGAITAGMLSRGAAGMDFLTLSNDLESRGITISATDNGDHTRISGSSLTEQLDHALTRARQILREPMFPDEEFRKLKQQTLAGLRQGLTNPSTVADRELATTLFGDSPQGRQTTLESLLSITLDDVKSWYEQVYRPNDAVFVIAGDVKPEQGRELARKLLADWTAAEKLPAADYSLPPDSSKLQIVLVDNPQGRQSTIRMGARAYTIRSDEKFPGSLIGRILSDGIHSRLDRYVRAEKGYTYGAAGYFLPGRHSGHFSASVDTRPETTADCIRAMFKVFNDMRAENVTPVEMEESQTRVAGMMVMEMQTIGQQAARRIDGILNGYPIDYYDVYAQRIAEVTADQVRTVMNNYVREDAMTIVVVAPADQVKEQLEQLGQVQVVPMPLRRTEPMMP